MKDKLVRIAKMDKELKFSALVHHVNSETLTNAFKEIKRNKATGVDDITVNNYASNLDNNIAELLTRMKSKDYHPKPVKRVYIPKAGNKDEKRPLGIPATEDKMVQIAIKNILEPIFESLFSDSSHGFRPNKSCHTAIKALDNALMIAPISYVVEVDIKQFFSSISHYWLQRCLEERISDPNMLWLIRQFLKAGIMENGIYRNNELGTQQGGNLSPLLANIYLHYVLDLWFEKEFKSTSQNYMQQIRYSDDFIVLFASQKDAERFVIELKSRLSKFGLEVAPDKTRIIKFGKWEYERCNKLGIKSQTFNFLGFTHYFHKSRNGKTIAGHKTSKDNLRRKLLQMKEWIRNRRNLLPLKDWMPAIKSKLTGHYNYFGVSGNARCLQQYYRQTTSLIFKWLNRRSQRKSMNWSQFTNYLQMYPLPQPRIMVNFYTLKPIK